MVELKSPFDILELRDGESKVITPVHFELGEMEIHPRYYGAPPSKKIEVLRVYVPRAEKPAGADYWDITSKTLIYSFLPFLRAPEYKGRSFKITAYGVAPSKRYSIELV
jgi:hypothetical protein